MTRQQAKKEAEQFVHMCATAVSGRMKTKHPRAVALAVAEELQAMLAPGCQRIAIAGSLRRGKAEVGDIELLYVPVLSQRPDGLFDSKIVDVCSEVCGKLLSDGVLAKRPNVNGHFAWGERNKLAIHVASGIPVDLFGTNEAAWWNSLVIRTGSKQMNLTLTNSAIDRGRSLQAYGIGVVIKSTGEVIPSKSEEDVFSLCGVQYREPKNR